MRKLKLHPCGKFNEQYEEKLTIFSTDFGRLWIWGGLFLLFVVIPFIFKPYHLYVINHIGIAAIAAIGLNILIGYTGQISLGHGAFFGVGAYAAAILATAVGFPFWLSVISAGVITALVGVVFGIPSVRLKHLYLTIATLAGQFILQYLFVQWESLTKGPLGIMLPRASLLGLSVKGDRAFYYVIFVCFVILTWIAVNLIRTRFGRAFIAIRDNDRAAGGMGLPIFITALNEILSQATQFFMNIEGLTKIALTIAPLREFVFGLAIVFFIIFEPTGLAEVWRIVKASFKLWPFSY